MTPPDDAASRRPDDAASRRDDLRRDAPGAMSRRHVMPYGAEIEPGGLVRFRLWAPSASDVGLVLEDAETLAMERLPLGWYSLATDRAYAGTRYRFRIEDGSSRGLLVPDPASRFQPQDVAGPSEVIDPAAYRWRDLGWRGRPWEEAVVTELHVGTFTPEGSFAAIIDKLDHLAATGITAIELMPVADFPGRRNWGYDGVLPYAPDSAYGRPEDLKRLIDAAHARGLMVLLDVVYNHFGPEGNYLHAYAAPFFTEHYPTPWGAAIDFSGPESGPVRSFFIHNALYWLLEYHFDGLRFDAVHAIHDDSPLHFLNALASEVRAAIPHDRHVHLILENDNNHADLLTRDGSAKPAHYTAQWNDDFHHAMHVVLTDDREGYYQDYADRPLGHLGRCLMEGFDYQGEMSPFRRAHRGQPSIDLPPDAFVAFLQNHDQIGNRAFGERLTVMAPAQKLALAQLVLLLSPFPPMLFMGEEWGATEPFLFFCDFKGELADAVREGRRHEFARFAAFADPASRVRIPDPLAEETFASSRLAWSKLEEDGPRARLARTRDLLGLRAETVLPLLRSGWRGSQVRVLDHRGFDAVWRFTAGRLDLVANFSDKPLLELQSAPGRLLAECGGAAASLQHGRLEAWAGAVFADAA